MFRFFPNAKRSLDSPLNLITDLVADGLLFFRLLFRSRTALSAEVLFLRRQLAFYEERQVQPRRLNDSARFSPILWSRLFHWKDALVIVCSETHESGEELVGVAVGTSVTQRPPHRSARAAFLHAAPTVDIWRRSAD
jgi:hypothetical protein